MQDRRGVVMVFYDLPMGTSAQRRHYTVFRKHLMREGFVQMQESLYVKLNIFCTIKTFGKGGFDVAFFSDDIFFA